MQKHLAAESKSINDTFTLPVIDAQTPITTFDKDVLLATTIRYFSTLPVLYDDPDWFYDECALWWDQYKYDFARMWMTNEMEYNPSSFAFRHNSCWPMEAPIIAIFFFTVFSYVVYDATAIVNHSCW